MDHEGLLRWVSSYDDVFLFGAGQCGKAIRNYLKTRGVRVSGFVVSETEAPASATTGEAIIDIGGFREKHYNAGTGLMLAIDSKYYNEVVPKLAFALENSFFLEDEFKRACLDVHGDKEQSESDVMYDSGFFEYVLNSQRASADALVKAITSFVRPETVIDVGCGVGLIANKFLEYGVREVFGIDGDYVDRDKLQLDQACFIPHDLTEPFISQRRYDLAISLEVAEHLDEAYALQFIKTLCNLSDNVVFSAAVPGQGGTNHVNEQPQSYWVRLFAENGYKVIDCIRPLIWGDQRVGYFYRQNTLLFVNNTNSGNEYIQRPVFDVIHPELLRRHHKHAMKPSRKSYSEWLLEGQSG